MSSNSQNRNIISVNAGLSTGNLTISVANLSQAVTATNNRAQYYAEQAKKFLSETRELFENTKYYAERNTDVTYGYIDDVKAELELDYNNKLALKQNVGECLLIDDLPENVSSFNNDSGYLVDSDLDEVRFPTQTGNQGKYLTTDGTNVGWENMPVRNVGETVFSLLPLTDSGLHLLDGSLINGNGIYSDFVDYIADLYEDNPSANYFTTEVSWQQSVTNYGVCGKFVYDSVNNTVRLPKVTGFVEGTIDLNALGNLVQAGLPNITGSHTGGSTYSDISDSTNYSGAMYCTTANLYEGQNSLVQGTHVRNEYFDASRSNAIYGRSSTVQPQAVKGFYYIVVATSQKTDIQIDIDEIVTDLNSKANKTDVDGQWVRHYATIASDVAFTTTDKNYDLSSHLPNDGNAYEVMLYGWCRTGSASGNRVLIGFDTVINSNGDTVYTCICGAQTRSTSTITGYGSGIVPMYNRTLTVAGITNPNGEYTFNMQGYRRIGTNQ